MNLADFHEYVYVHKGNRWPHWDNDDDYTIPVEWYTHYKGIQGKVKNLIKTHGKLNKVRDLELLKEVIYNNRNWIAIAGRSRLSYEAFEGLITDQNFLTALENFMEAPDILDNFAKFVDAWYKIGVHCGAESAPLRINRVAGACTDTVTSTAHADKFYKVFNKIKKMYPLKFDGYRAKQLNNNYYTSRHIIYFEDSQKLMSELKIILKEEGVTHNNDSIKISMFVWAIFLEIRGRFEGSCRL